MALEDLNGPSKFINALNALNPDGATDTLDEADDHMRGIKNVLLNSFPNVAAAITFTAAEANSWEGRLVTLEGPVYDPDQQNPIGTIRFSTDNTNPGTFLPGTWSLFAAGRTLIGQGTGAGLTNRVAGTTGGQEDAPLVTHTHDTDDPGNHNHSMNNNFVGKDAEGGNGDDVSTPESGQNTGGGGAHTHTALAPAGATSGVDENLGPWIATYIWERTA